VFEPHELNKASTVYGMAGALANILGAILAGIIAYIPGGGQMEAWRWVFRIVAICLILAGIAAWVLVPHAPGSDNKDKIRRLDLVGALLMLAAVVLLILGLTLGASYAWKKPRFLVPFLFSCMLFPAFFLWEHWTPDDTSILPSKTWKTPNFSDSYYLCSRDHGLVGCELTPSGRDLHDHTWGTSSAGRRAHAATGHRKLWDLDRLGHLPQSDLPPTLDDYCRHDRMHRWLPPYDPPARLPRLLLAVPLFRILHWKRRQHG
jgi:hypothetical protein